LKPAGQSVQTPFISYFPGKQSLHIPFNTPSPFVHKVQSEEASIETNPAGQSLHSVAWPPKPNFPTGQSAHSETIVAKYSPFAHLGVSVSSQEVLPMPSMFVWKPAPVQVLQDDWPAWSW
tara:strand:+ start:505 stop:864 length:360 start_codon:yes stop_codon:yes gene_type:complete